MPAPRIPAGQGLPASLRWVAALALFTLPIALVGADRGIAQVNQAPVFPATESGTRSVAENTGAGVSIGAPVGAQDPDNDPLTYRISDADAGAFAVVAATGQLQTKSALNFEGRRSYHFTITAADPDGAVDSIGVTLTITNVDESGNVHFVRTGRTVQARLRDPDGGVRGHTWLWARSADGSTNWTDITSATSGTYNPVAADKSDDHWTMSAGVRTGSGPFDHPLGGLENDVRYDVQVRAVNRVGVGRWSRTTVGIPSANDPPVFSIRTLDLTLAENAPVGRVVTRVTARDPERDRLTYTLEGQSDPFEIDPNTGQIRISTALDYETSPEHPLTVGVTDSRNAQGVVDPSPDDTMTVTVADVGKASWNRGKQHHTHTQSADVSPASGDPSVSLMVRPGRGG